MTTVPLTEAKARLNELVDEAVTMHEQITITRRGRPAAMLVSVEEWESLQETLFWQSVPGIHEDIAEARRERADGGGFDEAQVRSALGLPQRP
ncbi:MAG: type II toxin-antitoxin system Phd/YefM family antitoxin [Mobilicoccus sp.]|nr:type II toxin-antitoxin system Phd/YefM family antitoxin [Mobilicoccus sp.]